MKKEGNIWNNQRKEWRKGKKKVQEQENNTQIRYEKRAELWVLQYFLKNKEMQTIERFKYENQEKGNSF